MAMPPGGQSSWHHTSDSFHLLDEGDVVWGLVQMPIGRQHLELLLPLTGPNAFSRVLMVDTEGGRVTFAAPVREVRRPGGEPVAQIDIRPDALAVIDARGRARLLVCRGSEADPAWPPGGERGSLAGGAASFCMPVGPGMRVSVHAVSLP
ncbi:MAG TPA: hypothetical protein VIG06_03285 [Kofleriaceae bacterium]